ncbi:ABC transporter permease [Deinococcus roseus]|uniref:ABC transporter permease n=1 Tax=Deinococcus roseus TaxID=392414 RepID=A0ABQ2CXN8_9DEIO|nr:iron ABC transporter permease [Deinococcus roseus]GGJ24318.1 ABC transporter permease [Deinococcus roseus]
MQRTFTTFLLALIPLGFLGFFLIYPFVRALLAGAEGGFLRQAQEVLHEKYYWERIGWSLQQATYSSVLSVLLGVPAALTLARHDFPFKTTLMRILMLPLVTPSIVAAMGILSLVGARGLTGIHLQDTAFLVILGNVFYNQSLIVRFVYAGLLRIPEHTVQAARVLGANRWRVLWRVTLPLVLPHLLGAFSLVFLYCFSSFSLALLLGGQKFSTLEVEIYTLTLYQLDLSSAGILVLVQFLITGLAAVVYTNLQKRTSSTGEFRTRTLPRPQGLQWLQVLFWTGLTGLIALAPLLSVFLKSVLGQEGITWAFYRGILTSDTLQALWNTLKFSGIAMVLSVVVGGLQAIVTFRRASPALDALSLLPFLVSMVSVSVGYLLAYPGLSASLTLLIGAYVLLAHPFVTRTVLAGLRSLSPSMLQSARVLGASPLRVWQRVILPLLKSSIRTGAAFALASAIGEFAATLILQRPEWTTLSTLIYQTLGRPGAQNLGQAAALSSMLLGITYMAFQVLEEDAAGQNSF